MDPVAFAESLLQFQGKPVRLYSYQQEILREVNLLDGHYAIQKSRQVGLSWSLGIALCYTAYTTADARFLIISRTIEQSGFIFAHCQEFFRSSSLLHSAIDWKRCTKSELYLKNGTIIYHRTGGVSARNIRGFSLNTHGGLILDESAYLSDATVNNLLPLAQGCSVVSCSTPGNPVGSFWRACQPSSGYKHYKIPMSRCPRFSKADIDRFRKTMSVSEYARECLGEFAQGQAAVYDADSIERNIDYNRPGFDPAQRLRNKTKRNHVAAVDVSSLQGDPIVLAIGDYDHDSNFLEVIGLHVWAGTQHQNTDMIAEFTDNPDYVARRIADYCREFSVTKCYVDSTENQYYARTLLRRFLLPVEEVSWGNEKLKGQLVEHCSTCFRADKLSIPHDESLIRELLAYSYDLHRNSETGIARTIYLDSGRDDRHDAIAMLCKRITERTRTYSLIEAW